jgi:uncharacterized membrane protein YkoI
MSQSRSLLLAVALWLAAGPAAMADESDHERARQALQQGKIRALSEIMAQVRAELGGEVVKVKLDWEHGAYVYEFRVLAPDGRLSEVDVDAATGKVLKREIKRGAK